MYTKIMELNYWGSTECISAEFDEELQQWNVEVDRAGERLVLHPKQLVLATGMSGLPNVPKISGMEDFLESNIILANIQVVRLIEVKNVLY